MIVDGRALAAKVLARAKARAATLSRTPRVAAFVLSDTPATASYLSIKEKRAIDAGCVVEVVRFPQETDTATVCTAVAACTADALLVQLPLPAGINSKAVCDSIPLAKDADVLSTAARNAFANSTPDVLLPPVVAAIAEILAHHSFDPKGKRAVVVGAGFLVGEPATLWLTDHGAEVTVLTLGDDLAPLADADIIISGAGSPHLIKPEMIKEGVVLIDAGTSEASGKLAGDADPACAEHCSFFTPVPGGIGPLAVACLFDNATILAKNATHI